MDRDNYYSDYKEYRKDKKDKKDKKEKKDKRDKNDYRESRHQKDKKDKKKRDKSLEKKIKQYSKSKSQEKNRSNSYNRHKGRKYSPSPHKKGNVVYRFDSPPKQFVPEEQQAGGITSQLLPGLGGADFADILNNPNIKPELKNIFLQIQKNKVQQDLQSQKCDKKIYVGNIPAGVTTDNLTRMINVALRQMNLTESCVSTWISQEGNYGFVEFRSADEATRALNSLSSVQILGQQLKVGRPTQYIQQDKTTNPQAKPAVTTGFNQNGQLDILNLLNPGQILPNTLENTAIIQSPVDNQNIINTPNNILNNLNPVANFANSILLNGSLQQPIIPQINTQTNIPLVQNATLSGIPGLDPSKQIPSQIINIKIQVPTQVLVLKNMINDGELIIDEEYKQIEEDVKDECSKHGKVVSIAIPRPSVDDVKAGKEHVLGKGKIYVEYESIEAAREARRYLNGRLFSNRTVQVSYFNYQKYLEQDYDYQIK